MPDVAPIPDEVAALRAANARLREVIDAKDTEIAALRTSHQAQTEALRAQVAALSAEVADLRARLGQNPRNSSKPPSSEGLASPRPGRCGGRRDVSPGGRRGSRRHSRPHREPKCIRLRILAAAERAVRGGGLRLRLAARWPRASDLTTAVSYLHALARG